MADNECGKYDLLQIVGAVIGVISLAILVDYFFPFWARTLYYAQAVITGIAFAPLCWMGRGLYLSIKEKKSKI